jgi:Putative adhesin
MRDELRRTVRVAVAALALGGLLLASACAPNPMVRIDERHTVESLSRVQVLLEDGTVTVAEGRPGQILITGEYPQDAHEYVTSIVAGEAKIELRQPRGFRGLRPAFGQRGAHLEVILPPGVTLDVEGSNGAVDVTGPFRLERLKAANGAVTVKGALGPLKLEATNGRVRVEGHTGALEIRASNGAVDVTEQREGAASVFTSNGAIRYHGTIEGDGENVFETSNGAIEVIVAGTPAFTLDATTSNARISSRFAPLGGTKSENRLTGKVGEGATRLTIRTSNGAIEVR